METLPQPYTWTCDRCHQPIAAWDLDTRSPHDAPLCIECLLPITPEDARKNVELLYSNLDLLRERTHNPPGTLIGAEGPTMGQCPSYFAVIGVDAWDPSLPQRVRPCWWWEDGQGPSLIVLLAAIVTIDWPRKVAWELTWSWERPDEPAFCQLKNWNTPLSVNEGKRMMAALDAFRRDTFTWGRRRDDERVVCADFRQRLPEAIAAAREALAFAGEIRTRDLRQHELADALGISVATLQNRMRSCNMPWPRVKRMQDSRTLARSSP